MFASAVKSVPPSSEIQGGLAVKIQWKSALMTAALALSMGIAAPAWSGLADPMLEDYAVHVIPFYKINSNWTAFLVISDTSDGNLKEDGSTIDLRFFDAACNFRQSARLELTKHDSQAFGLHDPYDANGQFGGLVQTAPEGVILLDGQYKRFLTYVLLVNGNNNSLIRIDSIPCKGEDGKVCYEGGKYGTWLRYDNRNTVAATFGDTGAFRTNLYFFSAVEDSDSNGDLRRELLKYGKPRDAEYDYWADRLHLDAWCDELYLGDRRLDLKCTQRVSLSSLNFTLLNTFPTSKCAGKPGHIRTWAVNDKGDSIQESYSGFQETIAALTPPPNIIGTGYMHHSNSDY
jgi:hypothetical protein